VSLAQLLFFCVLTCTSLCGLQGVSALPLVDFFLCPDLCLPLWPPGSECPLFCSFLSVFSLVPPSVVSSWYVPVAWSLSFHILTCASLCGLQRVSTCCLATFCVLTCASLCGYQEVSAPCLVTFFLYPDLCPLLWYPVGECPLLGCFLSVS